MRVRRVEMGRRNKRMFARRLWKGRVIGSDFLLVTKSEGKSIRDIPTFVLPAPDPYHDVKNLWLSV